MRIQHNIAALNSNRKLGDNNNAVAKNLEKLSSGFRINRAGDDAAGLAISEKMRAQITGLETAQSNANDGISLVQTAEGALTEVHSMLNRMVELADQSANGTYDNAVDRSNLQKELNSLKSEVDRISDGTNFNGIKLLNGSMGTGTTGAAGTIAAHATGKNDAFDAEISGAEGISVQFDTAASGTASASAAWSGSTLTISVGGLSTDKITQDMINSALSSASGAPADAKDLAVTLKSDITFSADSAAQANVGTLTTAAAKQATVTNATTGVTVTSNTAGNNTQTLSFGDGTGTLGATVNGTTGNVTLNLAADKEYSANEINSLLSEAGASMSVSYEGTRSAGAATDNTKLGTVAYSPTGGTGLSTGGGLTLQIGDTADSFNQLKVKVGSMSTTALGINSIDISTQTGAQSSIDKIKSAINSVSSTRGDLGAIQNRLEHTINNLSVSQENMTSAESRIRDVDMAKEMMAFTKNNILTQASQSMLAQANQLPQGVLQLLQ
ncbi:MAG: flagellin [Lachnospiraceae bacterium]|nr:flagellin [Lachnospiraceae bacterium]